MDEHKKQEITPLNKELYADFSIQELESRLELEEAGCWIRCEGFCSPVAGDPCQPKPQ